MNKTKTSSVTWSFVEIKACICFSDEINFCLPHLEPEIRLKYASKHKALYKTLTLPPSTYIFTWWVLPLKAIPNLLGIANY